MCIALSPQAQAALHHRQRVSSRIMKAEFLTQVGPLMIIVVYAPTNQDSTKEKDQLQVIVMGESMHRLVRNWMVL